MPTYQYACTAPSCGERFELVQSFTDPAASECPTCAGPVRKVFSSVGVVFKGSGFYRTDSRSDSKASSSSSSSSTSSESGSASANGSSATAKSGSESTTSKPTASGAGTASGKVAASA